jgi:hypothetical protein
VRQVVQFWSGLRLLQRALDDCLRAFLRRQVARIERGQGTGGARIRDGGRTRTM